MLLASAKHLSHDVERSTRLSQGLGALYVEYLALHIFQHMHHEDWDQAS